jgi:hypothetical protein
MGSGAAAGVSLATDMRMRFDFSLDYRVFAFALIAATLAGLLAGLVPAVQASKTNLSDAMKEGGDRGWKRSPALASQRPRRRATRSLAGPPGGGRAVRAKHAERRRDGLGDSRSKGD